MKKTLIIRIVSFALLLGVMVAIFMFSAESASQSSKTSGKIIAAIAKLFKPDFEKLDALQQEELVGGLQSVTRTLAHLLIFAALGFFAINSLITLKISFKLRFLISIIFSVLYALSDEIHQHFVPGRAFQLSDLAVDTSGAILGTIVWFVLFLLIKAIINKRKPKTKKA